MSQTQRLLLLAPPAMTSIPAFERAAALAKATQLPLHIAAFDYIEALAVAALFAPEQMMHARKGFLDLCLAGIEMRGLSMRVSGVPMMFK